MKATAKAHISLFTAQVIYSISFVVAKILTTGYMPAFALVLLRIVVAAPLFWITASLFVREKTNRKDLPKLLLLAIFGVAINQMFFIKGLSLTTPISAAIMMITSPILVLIIAAILIKEKITLIKTIGIVLGFTGAAVLMMNSGMNAASGRTDNPIGDLMVFINAASWGMYLVMVKPMMKKYHTITILRWIFTFGLVLVLPFGYSDLVAVKWSTFTTEIWLYIVFVAVFTTYIAYILNVYALKELSPSVVSAYIYLQPLMTALLAISTGHDSINWMKVIAALLIFAGVFLASMNRKKSSAAVEIEPS